MNEADIRKYANLMQELGLTGLEITENNQVVRLERAIPTTTKETIPIASSGVSTTPAAQSSSDSSCIKSPIIGVFYASPAENAAPYVSIGDHVKKGQTLCIIEAMKLMNEITADQDGIITEICVTNGQVVEFGTELFRIQR